MAGKQVALTVAILGATGRVGQELLKVLEERHFPIQELRLLASARSKDISMSFVGKAHPVQEVEPDSFAGVDVVLASAGTEISQQWSPIAVQQGAVVIDNSNAFRMDAAVPLVVPEVNGHALKDHQGIIANPNCSTSQLVPVLKILHEAAGLQRVIVSTYQSVSGAGKEAMDELEQQTRDFLAGQTLKTAVFPRTIAFNLLPHIDKFVDDGYTTEELKMVNETRKILELPDLKVTATCVRVPVMVGHSESVTVDLGREMSAAEAREVLSRSPIIEVWDRPSDLYYPTPVDAQGRDPVYVGRIRKDTSSDRGLNLWIVADNLRIGAALNAVRIAEYLIEHNLLRSAVASR